MVCFGIWLQQSSDWLITGLYIVMCAGAYYMLNAAENKDWRPGDTKAVKLLSSGLNAIEQNQVLMHSSRRFLEIAIPGYLIALAVWINEIPRDFGIVAAILAVFLALQNFNVHPFKINARRGIIYITVVFAIYLLSLIHI